jgi:hypothetical protein
LPYLKLFLAQVVFVPFFVNAAGTTSGAGGGVTEAKLPTVREKKKC